MQRGLGRGLQALEINSRVSPSAFPHSLLHQDPLPRFHEGLSSGVSPDVYTPHLRNRISELESAFVTVKLGAMFPLMVRVFVECVVAVHR